MSDKKQYEICDDLKKDASKHCAALVITQNIVKNEKGRTSFAEPSDKLRNGILTFVKANDKLYGITWQFSTLPKDPQYCLATPAESSPFLTYPDSSKIKTPTVEDYIEARNQLIEKDLLAFDGKLFQLLSLPEKPVLNQAALLKTADDMERSDPATIHQIFSQLGERLLHKDAIVPPGMRGSAPDRRTPQGG